MRRSLLSICLLAIIAFGAGCQKQPITLQASNNNASAVLYLESHIEKANFGGKMFCAFADIPHEKNESYDEHSGYWIVACQEYYVAGKELKQGTGVSIPVLATLDPADLHVLTLKQPTEHPYTESVQKVFPKKMAKNILTRYRFEPDLRTTAAAYYAKQLQK